MTHPRRWLLAGIVLVPLALVLGCGGDADSTLEVAWSFESGDCASNMVETVRVSWGPQGGDTEAVDFACTDLSGTLGDIGEGGSFSITAEGLDAQGVARTESYGSSLDVSGGGGAMVDITLHPKLANVVVSWTIAGSGTCPQGFVLPFFIALYQPPAQPGDPLVSKVSEVQESCASGQATLMQVAPGDYVVELDSRAVSPMVYATTEVTVVPGEDASVSLEL